MGQDIELQHLRHLLGSGYDLSCSYCGQMYRKDVSVCEYCGNESFEDTREIIRKLELKV